MRIEPFFDDETATFTYLLADTSTGEAAVIDPVLGFDPVSGRTSAAPMEPVLQRIDEEGWRLCWILETHAHADHLTGAWHLKGQTGALLAAGAGIQRVAERFSRVFNLDAIDLGSRFDRLLEDGQTLHVGDLEVRVMATPGHTDDGITYLVGDAAFVGDTLFQPDFGTARCDFPGGDAGLLFDSVMRLHRLPDETRLFIGHDYPPDGREPRCCVFVADSRRNNVQLHDGVHRESFIAARKARDAGLDLPRLLLPALQVNIRGGRLPDTEDNGHRYLKIPLDMDITRVALGRE